MRRGPASPSGCRSLRPHDGGATHEMHRGALLPFFHPQILPRSGLAAGSSGLRLGTKFLITIAFGGVRISGHKRYRLSIGT